MAEVTRALVEVILILGQDLSLKFNLRGDVVLKSRLFLCLRLEIIFLLVIIGVCLTKR